MPSYTDPDIAPGSPWGIEMRRTTRVLLAGALLLAAGCSSAGQPTSVDADNCSHLVISFGNASNAVHTLQVNGYQSDDQWSAQVALSDSLDLANSLVPKLQTPGLVDSWAEVSDLTKTVKSDIGQALHDYDYITAISRWFTAMTPPMKACGKAIGADSSAGEQRSGG